MPPSSNHYETLKVPRNASRDTIRAAYKTLARRYHPDRNSNSVESHRLMQELNASFEVLNDSARRAEHDQWLARQEVTFFKRLSVLEKTSRWFRRQQETVVELKERIDSAWGSSTTKWLVRAGLLGILIGLVTMSRELPLHGDAQSFSANAQESLALPSSSPVYQRSTTAPNGSIWPTLAAEIPGYPIDRDDGKSIVVVDNSHNPADVFVKLVSLDDFPAKPVRHVYVPALATFECKNLRKGKYELRYQDLDSGLMSRSDAFEVVEMKTDRTVNFSLMKITLPKITDRMPPGYWISASEF